MNEDFENDLAGFVKKMFDCIRHSPPTTVHQQAIRESRALADFIDGDAEFTLGAFKRWQAACYEAGERIDPAEFKRNDVARSYGLTTNHVN